jgi:hypothetical protein
MSPLARAAQPRGATALPAGAYCQGPQADQPVAGPKKVIMLDLENESTPTVQSSPDATFQNNVLSQQCGTFAPGAMHNTTHFSESNYLAQVSGLNAAIDSGPDAAARFGLSDCPPDSTSSSCKFGGGHFGASVPSIFSQIEAQTGASGWKTYADDMQTNCEKADDTAYASVGGVTYRKYAVRHNPAVFFSGIACATQVVPSGDWQGGTGPLYSDLMSGSLPEFSFIVPNAIEDGHDPVSVNGTTVAGGTSQIGNADTYLSNLMTMIKASPDYESGNLVVMVTYDEGLGSGMAGDDVVGQNCADPGISAQATSCQIPTWIVGRYVPAHTYVGYMNQFGLLAATQRILGLSPLLGHAADSSTPDIVAGTATDPDPFNLLPTTSPAAPAPPTVGTAAAGDTSAVVSFTPSAGAFPPVSTYTVTSTPDGVTATGTKSPITVTGLTNGTAYSFTVTATNAVGTSAASAASNQVTPMASTVPGSPSALAPAPGTNQVALSWSPPATDGGSVITDYVVQDAVSGTGAWQTVVDGGSAATTATVTGLTGGTSYDFRVAAVNAIGQGPFSATSTATPIATSPELLPDPGFENGNGGWTPFIVGSFSRVATPTHGGSSALKIAATSSSTSLVGMTQNSVVNNSVAGTTYTASCWVQPTSANLNVQMRFLEYTQNYGRSIHLSTTALSNLPVGTWTQVKVSSAAVNSGERMIPQIYSTNETTKTGSLLYDDCSVVSGIPAAPVLAVPGAPTGVSAVAGDGSAVVSFTAPVSDGGSSITGYTVTASPGGASASGSASPLTVGGLSDGTSYTFTVTATNAVGTGAVSGASAAVVPAGVPGVPAGLAAVVGDGQVGLSWTAPSGNGAAVSDYVVQYRVTGTTTWGTFGDGVSAAPSATVTGLVDGTGYDFQVAAVNAVGTGGYSTTVTATPAPVLAVPGAPTGVSAVAGDGSAVVSFTAPVSDGGSSITGYTVTASPGGASASGSASPLTVGGLSDGTSYTFTVTATNAVGTGAVSGASAAVVPAGVPGVPAGLAAVVGDGQVGLSWTAPSGNGAAVSDYVVQYRVTGTTTWGTFGDGVSAAPSATVTGLVDGTGYDFQVAAVNAVGTGGYSTTVTATPAPVLAVPGAPTGVSAVAGDGSAVVSFTAPVSDGGSSITGYTVTASPGGASASGSASPLTVGGLSDGTSYTFTVTATNAVGTGAVSGASAAVVPAGVPGVPAGLAAVVGDGQVGLSWTAPSGNGAAVSDYVVQYRVTGTTTWGTFGDGVSAAPSATVTGLVDGTGYDFQVAAVNAVGTGGYSTTVTATPAPVLALELLPDPGFENGNGGWTPFIVGSFSRVATPTHGGSSALMIAATSKSTSLVGMTQNSVVNNSVAGTTYTASCWVQPTSANLNVQMRFLEYTQNYGRNIHLSTTVLSNLPVGTWTQVKVSSAAVNSGERMIPQIYSTNETTATGSLIYDDCSVTAAP